MDMYKADRKSKFLKKIVEVLRNCFIEEYYIKIIISKKYRETLISAFTSPSFDEEKNYEFFEQLGDVTVNKCIVQFFHTNYEQLNNKKGTAIVARLRINYGSKNYLYKFAEKLGFWDFISSSQTLRDSSKKKLLEDVFESFIGVCEYIISQEKIFYEGFRVAYQIIHFILKSENIDLDKITTEDLFDSKTIIKEMFQQNKYLGKLVYTTEKDEETNMFTTSVFREIYDKKSFLSKGTAYKKIDSEKNAAKIAIEEMKKNKLVLSLNDDIKKMYYIGTKVYSFTKSLISEDDQNDFRKNLSFYINKIDFLKTKDNYNFFFGIGLKNKTEKFKSKGIPTVINKLLCPIERYEKTKFNSVEMIKSKNKHVMIKNNIEQGKIMIINISRTSHEMKFENLTTPISEFNAVSVEENGSIIFCKREDETKNDIELLILRNLS